MTEPTVEEIALDNALISLYCFVPTLDDDKAILDNARATVDICFRAAVAAERERCANLCTTEAMGKEIVCPEECAAAIRAQDD